MQELIQQIIQETTAFLNNLQLQKLEIILKQKLCQKPNGEKKPLKLIKMFIEAKKIEGCSPKTLNYYESSIQHLLSFCNKQPDQLTTDDIRKYLFWYYQTAF